MIVLVNSNRMTPPIAPIGLDYVGGAARRAGIQTELVDLSLADDPRAALETGLRVGAVDLVGVTFRNVDDCFWPGGEWFVPRLVDLVASVRERTDAPVVLGGVGFSMAAERIIEETGADFGIHGDGESALVALYRELQGRREPRRVPGLVWRDGTGLRRNPPCWDDPVRLETRRDFIDNVEYFRRGGQGGFETKRGCGRPCIYCADPIAKGKASRLRPPSDVADELDALTLQGVDVLHTCDSEFNIPLGHAKDVCRELIRRGLSEKIRWYAYLAPTPFDAELARLLRQAGCVGINFGADSAAVGMLQAYRRAHRPRDIAEAVRLSKEQGITVMLDLLLGGPAETPRTVAETIAFVKRIEPDCVGAALGLRLYPGTEACRIVEAEGPLDRNPGVRRAYEGPVDLCRPTFYVSPALGERPAALVRAEIGNDPRFFAPRDELALSEAEPTEDGTHNYNDNERLADAIRAGARGAYWDILRQLRAL